MNVLNIEQYIECRKINFEILYSVCGFQLTGKEQTEHFKIIEYPRHVATLCSVIICQWFNQ